MKTSTSIPTPIIVNVPMEATLTTNITMIVGLISILTLLWKISNFAQSINYSMKSLENNMEKFEKSLMTLSKKYENIHFFLIKQHGIETVNRGMNNTEENKE